MSQQIDIYSTSITISDLSVAFGKTVAVQDLDLHIERNELFVLLGPSGCGKSTTLNAIAGLIKPTKGKISLGDDVVSDIGEEIFIRPQDRNLAMVFQDYAIYPHMTVYQNIAFPLQTLQLEKTIIESRVHDTAKRLDIAHLLKRKPKQLSGGQRQRVALARAIVRSPKAFLMDEPLSNLDAKLRVYARAELKKIHETLNATIVYVTHDQIEAMSIGDRIGIMNNGRLEQVGRPDYIYNFPSNRFVAGFIGDPPMNFFEGSIISKGKMKQVQLTAESLKLDIPRTLHGYEKSEKVIVGVRPEDITVFPSAEEHCLTAVVNLIENIGREFIVHLLLEDQRPVVVVVNTDIIEQLKEGEKAWIQLDTQKMHIFDSITELNLIKS